MTKAQIVIEEVTDEHGTGINFTAHFDPPLPSDVNESLPRTHEIGLLAFSTVRKLLGHTATEMEGTDSEGGKFPVLVSETQLALPIDPSALIPPTVQRQTEPEAITVEGSDDGPESDAASTAIVPTGAAPSGYLSSLGKLAERESMRDDRKPRGIE